MNGNEGAAPTHYRSIDVDGIDVAYRESGPPQAPVVLLLHGFPTSSRMFRNLIPRLSDRYRVIAPDYPGFGHSGVPDRANFAYTFDNLTAVVERLLDRLDVGAFTAYLMDFGGPVGCRLALKYPDRVTGRKAPRNAATRPARTCPSTPFGTSTCMACGTPRSSTPTTGSSTRRSSAGRA